MKDGALIARSTNSKKCSSIRKRKEKGEISKRNWKRSIDLEAKYKEQGYTTFKNCIKFGARQPKTDKFYGINPKYSKSYPFYPIYLDCSLNKAVDYEIYKKESVKEYEYKCGAVFSITPYDEDK